MQAPANGRSTHRWLAALAAPLLVAGCQTTPEPVNSTQWLARGGLERVQPADVAVAPVRDHSRQQAPADALREALYRGLIERLYSPLDLDYVDARWAEARFDPTQVEAEGVLQVIVTTWDPTWLSTHGDLIFALEARLLDAGRPESDPLWAVSVSRRISLQRERERAATPEEFDRAAAAAVAAEVLELLPERDPLAAAEG